MNRFHFFSLLLIGIFAASLSFLACKKEAVQDLQKVAPGIKSVTDRAPGGIIYGVTLYDGTTPSEIVAIDQGNGNVLFSLPAFVVDPNGMNIPLDNIKGICLTEAGQYFLTTGSPANPSLGTTSIYNNALFKVGDLTTGECGYVSTSPLTIGTVSDLEYDPKTQNFYGLQDNSNHIIEISGPAYDVYTDWTVSGIDPDYVLTGLSLAFDGNEYFFLGCASTNDPNDVAKLYKIEIWSGNASWWADLDPTSELGAGHCAIGFDIDLQRVLVNRSDVAAPFTGLNIFGWPPTTPVTNTFFYGAQGNNFEDLTSSVY